MGSTSDKISGKANEIAGKTKQAVGKAADDREMQAKGAVQEAEAMVATHASTVVEVDDLIAIVAGKKFHRIYLCRA